MTKVRGAGNTRRGTGANKLALSLPKIDSESVVLTRASPEAESPKVLTPNPHALQHELSYQVPQLVLEESKPIVETQTHSARPRVFVRRPNGKLCPARYGMDMFQEAHILYDRPLVVVEQNEETSDVIISAVQTINWTSVLRRQMRSSRNIGDESSDASGTEAGDEMTQTNGNLRIVAAGSFSYRKTWLGQAVRTMMGIYRLYKSPVQLCGYVAPNVRLAAVVIPRVMYKGRQHLMLTQRVTRKKNGTYNGMWVFPGGHVEAGETVEQGAAREFSEETGLKLISSTMKLQCCWQEVMATRKLQFLMMVFSADVQPSETSTNNEFRFQDLAAQTAEVATVALLPEELWREVVQRSDCNTNVDGMAINGDSESKLVSIPANDITGHHKGIGQGIGSGHKYALEQFLDPFDKHIELAPKRSRRKRQSIANAISRGMIFRRSSNGSSGSSDTLPDLTVQSGEANDESIHEANSYSSMTSDVRHSSKRLSRHPAHDVHSLVVAEGGDIIRMSPELALLENVTGSDTIPEPLSLESK